MSFRDITLKKTYRTGENDVINEFLVPALNQSIEYDRAVGFFSSSVLVSLSKGISGLVRNNGKINIVVSPKLSKEDIDAINQGYKNKNEIIEHSLIESLKEELNETDKDRLNLMIHLIECGILNIKIAVFNNKDQIGMYHEKIGILVDKEENKIAFTGSYNESYNSYNNNFESIDVFSTLSMDYQRVTEKYEDFRKLWNNDTNELEVKEFPEAVKEELFTQYYQKDKILSEEEIIKKENEINKKYIENKELIDPELRSYQREAVNKWKSDNYIGIFDMATGTGKTYTAIGASVQLYKDLNKNLAIIIVCPYTHLVEQWAEDLRKFNFNPIVGYGSSENKHWKEQLDDDTLSFKIGTLKYFCYITTNATFTTSYVQDKLKRIENKNVLFIADEAHNLGANGIYKKLNNNFKFRIALSATFERYGDEEGTQNLLNYFGNTYSIHYGLKKAIDNNMLSEYYYYPIIVYLTDDELDEYIDLTRKISKSIITNKFGKKEISEQAKLLLLKRTRIIAGAYNKVGELIRLLKKQQENENQIYNTLIYCGATTINDTVFNENFDDEIELKQIDYVRSQIKSNLNINVAKFTSSENQEQRKLIKEQFVDKEINVITAIKCLDEGVNIPSIFTAYILASSTNPREYVQRRGRVLRKAPGKKYANIYDFVTLPRTLSSAKNLNEETLKSDLGLIRRELTRIDDFASCAINFSNTISIKDEIFSVYGNLLNKYNEEIIE